MLSLHNLTMNLKSEINLFNTKHYLMVVIESDIGPLYKIADEDFRISQYYNVSSDTKLRIQELLNLGYYLIIYRGNYLASYSTISINSTTNYNYFIKDKEYETYEMTPSYYSNLTYKLFKVDLSSYFSDDTFYYGLYLDDDNNIAVDETYTGIFSSSLPLTITNENKVIMIVLEDTGVYNANLVISLNDYAIVYNLENLYLILVRIFITIGCSIYSYDSEGIYLISDFISDDLGILSLVNSYELTYRSTLDTDDVRITSKYPNQNYISLTISQESSTWININIECTALQDTLSCESFSGSIDSDDDDFIGTIINNDSELIEYISGTFTMDMIGTYKLLNIEDTSTDDYMDETFLTMEIDLPEILFILYYRKFYSKSEYFEISEFDPYNRTYENYATYNDTTEYSEYYEDYLKDCHKRIMYMRKIAIKYDTIVLLSPYYSNYSSIYTRTLTIIPPLVNGYSFEIVPKLIMSNRTKGSFTMEDYLDDSYSNEDLVYYAEIITDNYSYYLSDATINIDSEELNLTNYYRKFIISKWTMNYLSEVYLASQADFDSDAYISSLKSYFDTIDDVDVDFVRNKRVLTLNIHVYFYDIIQSTMNMSVNFNYRS